MEKLVEKLTDEELSKNLEKVRLRLREEKREENYLSTYEDAIMIEASRRIIERKDKNNVLDLKII